MAAKARNQPGVHAVPLQNTTQQPALQSLSDRATRKALFDDGWTRTEKNGDTDTRETIASVAKLRAEKAKLLGFPDFAAWKIQDQMAKTPEAALKFLDDFGSRGRRQCQCGGAGHSSLIDARKGGFALAAVRLGIITPNGCARRSTTWTKPQVRPYFELNRVLQDGVFYAATQLYGITFKERKDIPVYHPDVRVFEVTDAMASRSRSSTAITSNATTSKAARGPAVYRYRRARN